MGLFKTSSSTALIQKVAKSHKCAQEILELVNNEEKKLLKEQQQQVRKISQAANQHQSEINSTNNTKPLQQVTNIPMKFSPAKIASNISTHRRYMWIKCALIEKKLVSIVEHLADNSSKYYEPEALMSNYLCAQLLASLLVGPTALEFSHSKMHDYYQFDEPNADELLKRHKLASPIACLCNSNNHRYQHQTLSKSTDNNSSTSEFKLQNHHSTNNCARFRTGQDSLAIQANDENQHNNLLQLQNTSSLTKLSISNSLQASSTCNNSNTIHNNNNSNNSNNNQRSRRRPLALKTNSIKRGTLVTDCHHYSCQEMSEHHHTRGYSIYCSSSDGLPFSASCGNASNLSTTGTQNNMNQTTGTGNHHTPQDWSMWSPRMLHETLHQNSRSDLLYAKNNVLLETQPNETMAGYLSLHQFSTDLILKWIPNQMINGGQFNCCPCSVSLVKDNQKIYADEVKREEKGEEEEENDGDEKQVLGKNDKEVRVESGEINTNNWQEDTKLNGLQDNGDTCQHQHQMAVESSCLDLVVNLSVSRIVLLHCQFNILQQSQIKLHNQQSQLNNGPIAEQSACSSSNTSVDKDSIDPADFGESGNNEEQSQVEAIDSTLSVSRSPNTEETLILIEVDGVQRSPFKFPKGGLRLFLSCLESGLRPDRYLDPAIKFDDECSWLDPLSDHGPDQLKSPSPSETSTNSGSRLDLFLKRLPSLKRNATKSTGISSSSNENESRTLSPEVGQAKDCYKSQNNKQQQQPTHQLATVNYVYRIVCVQQQAWPLPTPPHSAFSIGSSSSGSMPASAIAQQQASGNQDRFRWSLSRLTRFSNRYKNSSSNNSTASMQSTSTRCCMTANGSFAGTSIQTNENTSSITSDTTSLDPTVCFESSTKLTRDSSSRDLARIEAKLHDLKESTSDGDVLLALRTHSIQTLCESMRKQIVARAFYGWLAYCRKARIVRTHLAKLIRDDDDCYLVQELYNNLPIDGEPDTYEKPDTYQDLSMGLTLIKWRSMIDRIQDFSEDEFCRKVNQLVYYGGIESDNLRKEVWPYLLGHYKFKDNEAEKMSKDDLVRESYESCGRNWIQIERIVIQRDREILAANIAKASKVINKGENSDFKINEAESAESCTENESASIKSTNVITKDNTDLECCSVEPDKEAAGLDSLQELPFQELENGSDRELSLDMQENSAEVESKEDNCSTDPLDNKQKTRRGSKDKGFMLQTAAANRRRRKRRPRLESTGSVGSDASITDQFGNNIHRIDKDVQRCDRSFWYFKESKNLEKLRNVMCTYVWQHLDVGYVQGMCDLAAPFLVIFDDEILAYSCFSRLMERMVSNFPHGCAMDQNFESLKYLMQVLDPKLFEILQNNGDYTHFYFCYRWLLLDFKRGKWKINCSCKFQNQSLYTNHLHSIKQNLRMRMSIEYGKLSGLLVN